MTRNIKMEVAAMLHSRVDIDEELLADSIGWKIQAKTHGAFWQTVEDPILLLLRWNLIRKDEPES